MPYPRGRHASWIVALLVAACSDAPTVPLPPPLIAADADLDLFVPALTRDLWVAQEIELLDEPAPPQAVSIAPSESGFPEEEEEPLDPATARSGIFNPRTFVYFNADHVYAQGEHTYQGNKSRIETTLNVHFEGSLLGTQRGVKEESTIFIISGLYTRYIQAVARVYTDHKCGLSADASSNHSAWWEAVMGSPVSVFHKTEMSSQSTRLSQPECAPPPPPATGGGGGGGGGGLCYVEVWYDEESGDVITWQLLFCVELGG